MHHALIVLNGPLPPAARYQALVPEDSLILCADGGADRALAQDLAPDFVIGDLDSISSAARSRLGARLVHSPSQDSTDLDKTLAFALEKGVHAAVVIGASGGRLDHQVCNLNILEKFSDRMGVSLVDDNGIGRFVRASRVFNDPAGTTLSLFAFRRAEGVSTRGLKYPLNEAVLEWAVNDGLSNEIVHSPAEIRVAAGVLFVYTLWPLSS